MRFLLFLPLLSACQGAACEGLVELQEGDALILAEAWVDPGFGVAAEGVRIFASSDESWVEAEVSAGSCAALVVPAGTWEVGGGVRADRVCTRTVAETVTVAAGETAHARVAMYAERCSTDTAAR